MYNVSEAFKNACMDDGIHKELKIVVGTQTYFNANIVDDSVQLGQAIFDGANFDICGCVSSSVTFRLNTTTIHNRGESIELWINPGNTEWLKLFTGFVDSCESVANSDFITITGYDIIYKLSGNAKIEYDDATLNEYDITDWFNNHSETTIRGLLNDLCSRYNITIDFNAPELVNGSVNTKCGGVYKVSSLSPLDLLKDIFRINGCFGYITNEGKLGWLYIETSPYDRQGNLYPSYYLFPSSSLYPGRDTSHADENIGYFLGVYKDLKYQNYKIKNIVKVVVADYEKDTSKGEAGSGNTNVYKIYGNLCTLGATKSVKDSIARNILNKVGGLYYNPYDATCVGLPYLLPGDAITYYDRKKSTYYPCFIFSRTLKLGQHSEDEFKAEGDQYQHTFTVGTEKETGGGGGSEEEIQNLQNQINEIDENIDNIDQSIEDLGNQFTDMSTDYDDFKDTVNDYMDSGGGGSEMINILSVNQLPAKPQANTIYLIRGDVVIL